MAIRKICASCGGYNKETATFCDKCGQSNLIVQEVADTTETGDVGVLINKSDNENLKKASQNATFMKYQMKWHDVLTSWFMIVWGIVNIASAIKWFSGSVFTEGSGAYGMSHEEALEMVYAAVPWLEGFAIGLGVFSVLYGIACFVIRPMLKELKKTGLYLFFGLMAASVIGNIVSVAGQSAALEEMGAKGTTMPIGLVFSLVYAGINIVYYVKRRSLFE